jgi:hypothetical protein
MFLVFAQKLGAIPHRPLPGSGLLLGDLLVLLAGFRKADGDCLLAAFDAAAVAALAPFKLAFILAMHCPLDVLAGGFGVLDDLFAAGDVCGASEFHQVECPAWIFCADVR